MTHTTSAEAPYFGTGVTSSLRVSPILMRMCAVHFEKIEQGPRQGHDTRALEPEDEDVLLQLVRCVTTGQLAGSSLVLRPSPPPVGETADVSMSQLREGRVFRFLVDHGVAPERVHTSPPPTGAALHDGRVEVRVEAR